MVGEVNGNSSGMERRAGATPRAPYVQIKYISLVAAGGALGTIARYGLSMIIPNWGDLTTATVVINVSGAFLLGWVLVALTAAGPEKDRRLAVRIFAGTGVLGGYTTYSMFAVDEDGLIDSGQFVGSLIYGLPTVALGVVAALAGSALAGAIHRRSIRLDSRKGTRS